MRKSGAEVIYNSTSVIRINLENWSTILNAEVVDPQTGWPAYKPILFPYESKILLIGIVAGGVQLGHLSTTATNRPKVSALGDYHNGEIGEWWLARKTEVLGENLPQCRFVYNKPHMLPGRETGPRGGKPATNRLIYGTVTIWK
jgi:hypothetical protein